MNTILNVVMSFLDYLSRLGEFKSIDVFKNKQREEISKDFYIMLIRVDTKRMS